MNIELAAKTYHLNNDKATPIDCFKAGVTYALKEIQKRSFFSKVTDENISVDLDEFLLTYNGEAIKTPKKVLQLLHLFISNKGKVITRQTILERIWGDDVIVTERTVDVHVRKIKIVLNDNNCIKSYKGIGYKWK